MELTPHSGILFVKLLVTQLVRKLSDSYGARRFITVFTRAQKQYLSWATWIHSTLSQPISLRPVKWNIIGFLNGSSQCKIN